MKLSNTLIPAAMACALFSGQAMAVDLYPAAASDNTVTFLGQVSDSTCVMSINGQDVKPVVLLPTVPLDSFGTTGSRAGTTDFVVSVSGCPIYNQNPARALSGGKYLSTMFVAHETADTHLMNTITPEAGGAKNIHINIIDTRDYDINFSEQFHGERDLVLNQDGTASATYRAQYISHAEQSDISSGYVRASMQYALSYD